MARVHYTGEHTSALKPPFMDRTVRFTDEGYNRYNLSDDDAEQLADHYDDVERVDDADVDDADDDTTNE